jgi:hypothetical protein
MAIALEKVIAGKLTWCKIKIIIVQEINKLISSVELKTLGLKERMGPISETHN